MTRNSRPQPEKPAENKIVGIMSRILMKSQRPHTQGDIPKPHAEPSQGCLNALITRKSPIWRKNRGSVLKMKCMLSEILKTETFDETIFYL